MKKMKNRYFVLASLLILTSCSADWVNVKPLGSQTTSAFWQSPADIDRACNALYAGMSLEPTFGQNPFYMMAASDDVVVGRNDDGDGRNIKNFNPLGNEYAISTDYREYYKMIDKANQMIANIDKATNISDALRNRAKGEGYFMRGFIHFWVASIWGCQAQGVPFDGPENPEFQKRVAPQLPSVTDNYAQIISDLQKAADLLPLFETYGQTDWGRAHKVAAWAYMVKTYAYWAQFDPTKWALIPPLCDKIRDEGNRSLVKIVGDPKGSYQGVFKIANNWSSEYIWSVNSGLSGGSEFPGVILENGGWGAYNGWGYFHPTEELYEEYEATDPRREVTILKFGDSFKYFGTDRLYASTNSQTGFQINKYMEPFGYGTSAATDIYINQNGNSPNTLLNLSLIRYAEILLLKAEALIQTNQSGLAAAPLNEVRARVGLAPIVSPTMTDLKHERRCELACEWSDRFYDLKRWGDFDKIRQPLHGRQHTDKTDPNSPYTIIEVWPARTFVGTDGKKLAWPYDPAEIQLANGAYKQNPGW